MPRILIQELIMLIDTARTRMLLERGQSTRLTDARQAHLASASGTLWVTIDNDPRDIVLEAGEGFDVISSEPLLICALGGPAVMDLRPVAVPEPAEAL
jgi:hypothetical protein